MPLRSFWAGLYQKTSAADALDLCATVKAPWVEAVARPGGYGARAWHCPGHFNMCSPPCAWCGCPAGPEIVPAPPGLERVASRRPPPSVGSSLHAKSTCTPCAWHSRPGGCPEGQACAFCHVCPDEDFKARRKARAALQRVREPPLLATASDASTSASQVGTPPPPATADLAGCPTAPIKVALPRDPARALSGHPFHKAVPDDMSGGEGVWSESDGLGRRRRPSDETCSKKQKETRGAQARAA